MRSTPPRRRGSSSNACWPTFPTWPAGCPPDIRPRRRRTSGCCCEANARLNLTRLVEPADVARLHLLDALSALPFIDASGARRVVDLGSGGGVPAIPLALARPEVEFVMVDSVHKKAANLEAFITQLRVRNAGVIAERAEALGRDARHRERYDLATARACAPLPVLVELALPLVRPGGSLLAWKGPLQSEDEEVTRGVAAARMLGARELKIRDPAVPQLGGHTFVVATKVAPTPRRYPRRPGEPGRSAARSRSNWR